MTTFEDAVMNAHVDTATYERVKADVVARVKDVVASYIAPEIDAEKYANRLVDEAEWMGRFRGDCVDICIPSYYSASGFPINWTL